MQWNAGPKFYITVGRWVLPWILGRLNLKICTLSPFRLVQHFAVNLKSTILHDMYPVYIEFLPGGLCPLSAMNINSGQKGRSWLSRAEMWRKATTLLDFMDYWHLLRPAGQGIILVSLFNWMRVSGTGVSRVKVIGLTSEYHVCNPLVWYLSALATLCSLS